MHWRTTSSNSLRNIFRNVGFRRWSCEIVLCPVRGQAGLSQDTTAAPHPSGCAARFAALGECHTESQPTHEHYRVGGRMAEPFAVKRRGYFIHKRQVQRCLQTAQKVVRRNQIFYREHVLFVLHRRSTVLPPLYLIKRRFGRHCQQLQNEIFIWSTCWRRQHRARA